MPIVGKTMSEANSFTPSTDNDHRSACCQKHGSFSGPAASIVSFNCEGLSEAKEVLIAEMCLTNSCVALCLQETHRTENSRQISLRGGAGRKTILFIFQPSHFIVHLLWSVWKNIEKKSKNIFFPRLVSMEMAAIFDFRALTKVHLTSKPLLQMQWKFAHT